MKALAPLALAALLAGGCGGKVEQASHLDANGEQVGRFKGYVAIDMSLRQKILAPTADANLHLSRYLGVDDDSFSGLVALLGGYSGGGASTFHGGDPNAMNMLLWQMTLNLLSQDIVKSCDAPAPADSLPLSTAFLGRLLPLCNWPAASVKTPDNLKALWLAVVGYAAPEEEMTAWQNYFLAPDSPYAGVAAKDAVGAMLMAMFLNPNFLLAR